MLAKRLKAARYSIPIILFFVITLFVFGPFELFYENAEEFWFSGADVGKSVFAVAGAVFIVLCLFFIAVPKKVRLFCEKILFGISLGLYVQARINISYGNGVLDGQEIPWDEYDTYGAMSSAVWLACLALPFIIKFVMKRLHGSSRKVLAIISVFLTVIQIPGFVADAVDYHKNRIESSDFIITTDSLFHISDKENIIIFVLDTMDEAYYRKFLEEYPKFTEELTGFVHYENTLASGARTMMGLPSMFTGIPFTRTGTYTEYKDEAWGGNNPLRMLHDKGYDVAFYSENFLFSQKAVDYLSNFKDGKSTIGSYKVFSKKLYKLDFLKFAPHYLKRFFWMDTAEFNEAIDAEKSSTYILNDPDFFEKFSNEGFSYDPDKKSVQIYHLNGAHSPYILTREGEYRKKGTIEDQVHGCFICIGRMLDDLKKNGAYDDATIIITSDHGDMNIAEHSTFLLKKSGADAPYRTSAVPVSMFDLPIFLADIAGEKLENQQFGVKLETLKEDQNRERHIFVNATNNNSKVLVREYVTTDKAGDHKKIALYKAHEDLLGKDTLYELGTELSFTADATGNRYIVEGFGKNSGEQTRVSAKYNRLEIPIEKLPKKGTLKGFVSTNTYIRTTPYIMKVNGITVLKDDTSKSLKNFSFEFPVSSFGDSNILIYELEFPEYESIKNEITYKGIISFKTMVIEAVK